MSAVAIPFDPTFTLGPRSNFAWPGSLDSSADSVFNQDQRAYSTSSFEGSPSPSTAARSLSGSPSIGSYTPESNNYRRDIKREQNRARRDSRLNYRMRRAHSTASSYDSPPPMAVGEGLDLPTYSSVPSQLPVLSESPSSISSGHYVSSYTPPLPEHQPAAPMFPTPYQSHMPPTYPITVDYSGHYDSHSAFSRQSPPLVDNSILYPVPSVLPPSASSTEGGHVRVVQSRPKPRCWEHGCNGRQFSTFSNLLRHQREKSGQATKASCPNCGAEFTRTTARNGHLLHDKCKQRNRS